MKEERLTEGMTPWHCALSLVATKERLKTIDRPLFGDFWERFVDSLKALRDKQQRTVYRLTLVKGWNVEELDVYSELIKLGKPDFIAIKGGFFKD